MQIISDYLAWNQEKIEAKEEQEVITYAEAHQEEQTTSETSEGEETSTEEVAEEKTPRKNPFAKIGGWFKSIFKKSKKEPAVEETSIEEIPEAVENELIDAPAEAQEVGTDTEQINPETEEVQTESEKEAEVVYSE